MREVDRGGKSESEKRAGKDEAKGSGKLKPKAKKKPKRKRPSGRGAAQEARERAAGLIPSPNVGVIASDPLKAQIVAVAIRRLYSPSEYAREADVPIGIASYAFKVLREKGILELVEAVPIRGSTIKHMYRATEAAFISDADWGELADALQPGMAGTTLQDFNGRVVQAMMTGHFFEREDACLYWAPRDLDEIAWKEQVEIIKWCIEASKQLEVDTVNRRANGKSEGSFHTTFGITSFLSPTDSEFKKYRAKGKPEEKTKAKRKAPKRKAQRKAKGSPVKAKGAAKSKGKGKGGKA